MYKKFLLVTLVISLYSHRAEEELMPRFFLLTYQQGESVEQALTLQMPGFCLC